MQFVSLCVCVCVCLLCVCSVFVIYGFQSTYGAGCPGRVGRHVEGGGTAPAQLLSPREVAHPVADEVVLAGVNEYVLF